MEVQAIDEMTLSDLAKKLDGLEGGVVLLRLVEGLHARLVALEQAQATFPLQVAEIVAERVLAVLEKERFGPLRAQLDDLSKAHLGLGALVETHSTAILEGRAAIRALQGRADGPAGKVN